MFWLLFVGLLFVGAAGAVVFLYEHERWAAAMVSAAVMLVLFVLFMSLLRDAEREHEHQHELYRVRHAQNAAASPSRGVYYFLSFKVEP